MRENKGFKKTYTAILKGVNVIIPFAVTGGVLITFAYIIDMIFSKEAMFGLGNENPVAVIFKSLGTLILSLMLPVLSSAIAVEISEKGAFIAGLAGGFLTQSGSTLALPFGDTTAVSGVIGALLCGILAGYLYNILKTFADKLKEPPRQGIKTVLLPLFSVLTLSIILLCINPLVGLLNTGLSAMLMVISKSNPIAFGAVLGIMTAVDMGGVFSKAAFIFATAAIASGEFTAMAAVMSAGMSISLSVALCSLVFNVKFTQKEARLAKMNLIFGIFDITEGVIPIAAKSPASVIPACTIGSAVSGALSAGFGCTLIAPFGGILVLPLVNKPLFFAVSVLAGSLVGAVVLGIIKKEPKIKFSEPEPVKVEVKK